MLLNEVSRTTPLVVLFAGICLGILTFMRDLPFALFTLLFTLLLFRRDRIFIFSLGIFLGFASMFITPHALDIREGDYHVRGTVQDAGFMQGTYRVVLDDVAIGGKETEGLLQLRMYENVRELEKGCVLECTARLKPWLKPGNRGGFDYRTYMLASGVTASGYVKDIGNISIPATAGRQRLKTRLSAALARDARPEAEILNAALTGDRSGLAYSLQDSFSSLGVTHLIAISGLNMAIVFLLGYSAAFLALRLVTPVSLRFDTPLAAKMTGLACVILYTLFVGYSHPAARAAIMVCTAVASLLMARRPSLMESLAFSGIIILLWMPYSLYSASFLLSFSAVLGIIGVYGKREELPAWVMILAIPLVCTAFTSPMVMYLFGFVSNVGVIANIVFVPWFSFVIMPLGLAGLVCLPVWEGLSSYLLSLAFDGTGVMLKAADTFGSLAPVPCPGLCWVMICYAGLVAAFFGRPGVFRSAFLRASCLLIIALPFGASLVRSHQGLVFDFIDVGQADSILITRGDKSMLIDAGSSLPGSEAGRFIVGPHLLRRGITKLDLVVMTHAHPDHIGGMPFILSRFEVGEVWANAGSEPSPDFLSAVRIARQKSIPVKSVCLGDSCALGGIRVQVLAPPGESRVQRSDLNLNSIVLRAGDAGMKGLFMADACGLGEIRLSRLHQDITAEVLKVSHHGSKQSCLDMFLDRIKPSLAVIPVGLHNRYRLPHGKALARLKDHGIPVFRTDESGGITVFSNSGQLHVKSGLSSSDKVFYSTTAGAQSKGR